MEKLADSGLLAGVIDVSTTEIADEIGGGVLSAGPTRLDVFARRALPYVGSCGALDMVNFGDVVHGARALHGRSLYRHNPTVTLMRTTADECRAIGEFIADKLNAMQGPVRFLIPEGGVSAIDRAGPAVPRPRGRPGAVRPPSSSTSAPAPNRKLHPAAATHQRRSVRRRPGRRLARRRRRPRRARRAAPERKPPCPASPRQTSSNASAPRSPRGRPIIGGGAGTGLSAKCEEAGGIDLIVIYNSGRYRMAGRGSLAGLLAYGNANEIVCEMAREVLPVVQHTPVLAGVNGTDPFMIRDEFLRRLIDLGFSGVQNFPTVGPHRRHLPRQPRGDRHGLRARGRADPRAPASSTC